MSDILLLDRSHCKYIVKYLKEGISSLFGSGAQLFASAGESGIAS